MIIESGVIIFLGFCFLFWKMPRSTILYALGWPLVLDVAASAIAYILHWGTFSGIMAAAVAGFMVSAMTSAARWSVGYVSKGIYYPGHIADWRQSLVRIK
jgi:hypothetical protein